MESRHHFDATKVLKLSTHARDAFAYFQQISQGSVPHYDNNVRLHCRDLAKQKRPADCGFLEGRLAIARRPAAIDVADQDVFALHANRFDDLGQQLTGPADERSALGVFISARGFTYKHQTRLVISMSIDDLCPTFAQTATGAIAHVPPYILHAFRRLQRCGLSSCERTKKRSRLWRIGNNRCFHPRLREVWV